MVTRVCVKCFVVSVSYLWKEDTLAVVFVAVVAAVVLEVTPVVDGDTGGVVAGKVTAGARGESQLPSPFLLITYRHLQTPPSETHGKVRDRLFHVRHCDIVYHVHPLPHTVFQSDVVLAITDECHLTDDTLVSNEINVS